MNNGQKKVLSSQASVLIHYGYIVVPKDVDRDTFVEQCYRWERVSILGERGGLYNDCYISRSAIRDVEFPSEYKKLGSCISYFVDPYSSLPIVLQVFSKEDETQLLREGVFKIVKNTDDCIVSMVGDSKKGVLNLSVRGGSYNKINLVVSGKADGEINLRSSGNINLHTTGNVTVESEGDILFNTDSNFKINNGTEPMIKGSTLKNQLDQNNTYQSALVSAIESALGVVAGGYVSAGALAVFQAAMAAAIQGNWDNIRSQEAFLDK